MGITTSYQGTIRYIRTRWPTYLLGYGGGIALLLLLVLVSLDQGWFGFVNLAFAGLLMMLYFSLATLWAIHRLYDDFEIIDQLIELGEVYPDQRIIYIDLGLKSWAVALSRHLTTGRVIVIDVYNPQLAPARWLSRANRLSPQPEADPRLDWKGGSIDLLPLPDNSVPVIILNSIVSEFWQDGDREELLSEALRVLANNGLMLCVERVRTLTNWLVLGPGTLRYQKSSYWRNLLERRGFSVVSEKTLHDMLQLYRVERKAT